MLWMMILIVTTSGHIKKSKWRRFELIIAVETDETEMEPSGKSDHKMTTAVLFI